MLSDSIQKPTLNNTTECIEPCTEFEIVEKPGEPPYPYPPPPPPPPIGFS